MIITENVSDKSFRKLLVFSQEKVVHFICKQEWPFLICMTFSCLKIVLTSFPVSCHRMVWKVVFFKKLPDEERIPYYFFPINCGNFFFLHLKLYKIIFGTRLAFSLIYYIKNHSFSFFLLSQSFLQSHSIYSSFFSFRKGQASSDTSDINQT